MDADNVEIPPPIHHLKNQNRAILHDVIDIDDDDDLVTIGEKVSESNKGKTIEAIHQVVAILDDVIDIDDDDDFEDLVIIGEKVSKSNKGKTIGAIHQAVEVSDYTFCQPGMENFGPVSGIESSNGYPLVSHNLINVDGHGSDDYIDIFSKDYVDVDEYILLKAHLDNLDIPPGTEYDLGLKKSTFKNSPWYDMQSDAKNSHVTDFSQPSWSLDPNNSKIQGSTMGSSNLQIKMDNVDHSSGAELSSPQLFSQAAPSKKKSAASQCSGHGWNLSLGVESSKSKRFLKSFCRKMKSASFGSKNHGLAGNPEARKLLHAGSSSSYHANSKDEILRKFQNFKQFDSVSDASDHHFIHITSSMKQHPKNWAKEIQKEWKMLEKDLPDSIFVRVYESRMDLLRAVIIGVEGTPYHDGLFFFDVYFPSGYPNEPPLVYFHSQSLSLNPNLFYSGGICLSLLNTWAGSRTQRWIPRVSTILQVLVSMQGLILNSKPFFNKPEYEGNTPTYAESMSLKYNEDTFIESLRAMMYTIRRPPKNFEDFVVGHFISRAHDILVACNAYMEGAQVGCLVKGRVQDVDEGDKSCSKGFKYSLSGYMSELIFEFERIGAKDCEKFLSAAKKAYETTVSIKAQILATSTTGRFLKKYLVKLNNAGT